MTPPGSPCSVIFGKGVTSAAPAQSRVCFSSSRSKTARAQLLEQGAEVSDVFHFEGGLNVTAKAGRVPGPDPQGRSYSTWASFADPDGNGWLLQEIKKRCPDAASATWMSRA